MTYINKKGISRKAKKKILKRAREITGREAEQRAGPIPEETLEEMKKEKEAFV